MIAADILAALQKRGFVVSTENKHATVLVDAAGLRLAVKHELKTASAPPLVVHPEAWSRLGALPRGVRRGSGLYRNTNMRGFPKSVDNSASREGVPVFVDTEDSLDGLLVALSHSSWPSVLDDIAAAEPDLAGLSATEREAVVAARLGQGRFRTGLEAAWGAACAVTGINVGRLLRASHIKRWSVSDNRERLDPENGLLLVATLDAAFDAGLISFDTTGAILFSPRLGAAPHATLSITPSARLGRAPSAVQSAYLAYHQAKCFSPA